MKGKTDFLIWIGVVAIFLIIIIVLFGSVLKKVDEKTFCEKDSECVCGGIDRNTGECFVGNNWYYDRFVDKTQQCPDFCTGIAGNLEVRCVDNKCVTQ